MIKIIQSFLLLLPLLFSVSLFTVSLFKNIDIKTKIKIKSVFFKFTKVISIAFYIFHIMSCMYWVFFGGSEAAISISSKSILNQAVVAGTTTSSTLPLKINIIINSSFKYYFKLLIQSIKFYRFNDTIIILLPLIFSAISMIFVYIKNSLVNKILFIKIQGLRNETPAGYDLLIRVLYIFMFIFILLIGHFGNLVCLKVNAFEKIGICSYHSNFQDQNFSKSFWYIQGFINTIYLVYGYPLYELVNLI